MYKGGKRKKIRLLYSLIFGACFITFRLAVFLCSRLHHVQSFVPQHGFELMGQSGQWNSCCNDTEIQTRQKLYTEFQ